jgi:hypothetical protein
VNFTVIDVSSDYICPAIGSLDVEYLEVSPLVEDCSTSVLINVTEGQLLANLTTVQADVVNTKHLVVTRAVLYAWTTSEDCYYEGNVLGDIWTEQEE